MSLRLLKYLHYLCCHFSALCCDFSFLVSRFSLCTKQGSAGSCRLGGIRTRLKVICRSWGLVKLHVLDFHFWVINSDDFADGFRLWRWSRVWNLLDREFWWFKGSFEEEQGRRKGGIWRGNWARGAWEKEILPRGLSGSQLGASWKDSGNGGGLAPLVRPVSKGLRGWPCWREGFPFDGKARQDWAGQTTGPSPMQGCSGLPKFLQT